MKKIIAGIFLGLNFLLIPFNIKAYSLNVTTSKSVATVGDRVIVTISGHELAGYVSVNSSNESVLAREKNWSATWVESNPITFTFFSKQCR